MTTRVDGRPVARVRRRPSASAVGWSDERRPARPWVPVSPCGDACSAAEPRDAGRALRALRWAGLAAAFAVGACVLAAAALCRVRRLRVRAARGFAWLVLRSIGVRVEPVGAVPAASRRAALVVANHESLLDIVAVAAVAPAGFVARSELRDIAVLRPVTRAFGVLTVERENLRALPGAVEAARRRLAAGRTVAVFPEATTYCGAVSGEFRPAFFEAAARAGTPVVPITVRYTIRLPDGAGARRSAVAAFVGADTAMTTLRRVIGARGVAVRVHVADAIDEPGLGRRELARRASALSLTPSWPPPRSTSTTPRRHP